jgi:hypothetical protein
MKGSFTTLPLALGLSNLGGLLLTLSICLLAAAAVAVRKTAVVAALAVI